MNDLAFARLTTPLISFPHSQQCPLLTDVELSLPRRGRLAAYGRTYLNISWLAFIWDVDVYTSKAE